jgi:glycosyltransferase involved in cell wall biosynthesis
MKRKQTSRAIVSVINDLSTDQRVDRTCRVLQELGYDVMLLGRRFASSLPVEDRSYTTHRFRLLINSGPLFYLIFNIRLFFFLLIRKADLLWANDADTLLANGLISKIKGVKLVYDSHELFSEVPELVSHPLKRKIWRAIEDGFAPKAAAIITVNESISRILGERFGRRVAVVRNMPFRYKPSTIPSRSDLGLPGNKHILILQGSGINIDRGAEEILRAMSHLDGFYLLIAGSGDVIPHLQNQCKELGLENRVRFLPKQPYARLMEYTAQCDAGLSLDKDTNLNYRFSLPNKLFDYIQAGIPVIASKLPEINRIIATYKVGVVLPDHIPANMAAGIKSFFDDAEAVAACRKHCTEAAGILCWEVEKQHLIDIVSELESNINHHP